MRYVACCWSLFMRQVHHGEMAERRNPGHTLKKFDYSLKDKYFSKRLSFKQLSNEGETMTKRIDVK